MSGFDAEKFIEGQGAKIMNVSESVSDDVLDKIGKEFSDRDGAAMMMCISAVCASLMWKTYAAIRLCEGKIKKEGAADTWVSTVFTYPLAPKDRTVQIVKSEQPTK